MSISTSISKVCSILFIAGALAGCGDAESDDTGTGSAAFAFTEDAGGGLFVGIVGNGSAMTGYVCDGDDTAVTVSRWFEGAQSDGHFNLDDGDGARLSGDIAASSATISIELPGADPVEVHAGAPLGDAVLLRGETSEGEGFIGGWIFVADGDARGSINNQSTGILQTQIVSPRDRQVTFTANGAQVTMPIDSYINAYLH